MNIVLTKFDSVSVKTHLRHAITSISNEIETIRQYPGAFTETAQELVNAKTETVNLLELLYSNTKD